MSCSIFGLAANRQEKSAETCRSQKFRYRITGSAERGADRKTAARQARKFDRSLKSVLEFKASLIAASETKRGWRQAASDRRDL